ncbi:MAG: hypothetical protein A2X41_06465 [Candidatus Margulisbacteria bacterium GWE2_39_32]|nr:MAG: hypothetical protein A2X41_06465 [Candidatus Margulisbacteria bacterium GWE2_39_32]
MATPGNRYFTFSPEKDILIVFSGKGFHLPESMIQDFALNNAISVQAEQVHGSNISISTDKSSLFFKASDAIITIEKNHALFIRTADCVPVLMYDRKTKAICAAHAGLKGTIERIVPTCINKMQEIYGSSIADIYIYIGPCIHQCCYEVDQPIIEKIKEFPFYQEIISPSRNDHFMLDLQSFNIKLIKSMGIAEENIFSLDLCTGCRDDLFYSFRKRKESNRMFSMIIRKG